MKMIVCFVFLAISVFSCSHQTEKVTIISVHVGGMMDYMVLESETGERFIYNNILGKPGESFRIPVQWR